MLITALTVSTVEVTVSCVVISADCGEVMLILFAKLPKVSMAPFFKSFRDGSAAAPSSHKCVGNAFKL